MSFRILYTISILCLLMGAGSCGTSHHSRGPKEYKEKNGLNDPRKPHQLATEIGNQQKGQKRAYRRQLRKEWKKKNPGSKRSENPYR